MLSGLRTSVRDFILLFPAALAKLGVVDRHKGEEAFDLAVPVMVTGTMRTLLRTADFFMVSIALGPAAVAALAFGFQYFFIALGLALAVSSGTISVVSRFLGAGNPERANLAIKQSLWLALLIAVPLTLVAWFYPEFLIDLLTDDPRVIDFGATYLKIVMLSASIRFWGLIGSRALAGAGDTRTPMYIRMVTVPTNITLNAILIFGLGPFPFLGVAGAAIGTVLSNTLAGVLFFGVLVSGRFPVSFPLSGPHWDTPLAREIVRVGLPLSGMRLAQSLGRFPFLFVLGVLGTQVVAAYAIAQRLMMLARMPAWGYSTASSTLVGQSIGAGEDDEADAYGWQTLRIALATQLLIAAVLVALAYPLASLFGADNVDLTVEFIYVAGLTVAGFSIGRTISGGLRGAGDTKWPFYGTLAGTYGVRLPISFLALPSTFAVTVLGLSVTPGLGIGLVAVYIAIIGDFYTRALVNGVRFYSGHWKTVARSVDLS